MWQRRTAASLRAVVGAEGHAAPAEEEPVEPIELVGLQDVAILVLGRGSERCEVGRRWTVAVEREHHLAGRRRPLTRPKRRDRALVVDEGEATLPCSARISVGTREVMGAVVSTCMRGHPPHVAPW